MANENPTGDQTKKQSPTKQTTAQDNRSKPQDTSGGAPKQGQPGSVAKPPAKQGKRAPDQGGRTEASRQPKPPAVAPKPASLAKPGTTPNSTDASHAAIGASRTLVPPSHVATCRVADPNVAAPPTGKPAAEGGPVALKSGAKGTRSSASAPCLTRTRPIPCPAAAAG